MVDDNSLIYGLEFQARSLTAQVSESEKIRFIIGTQSLKIVNNQVHLIELDEDNNTLNAQVYKHKSGEIWALSSHISNTRIIASAYNSICQSEGTCNMKASLWKFPDNSDSDLEMLSDFDTKDHGSDIKTISFHPNNESQIAIVIDNKILVWDIIESSKLSTTITMEGKGQPKFTTGKWNPPVDSQFATANDCSVKGWDIRDTTKQAWAIENAHLQLVRDLDFNPNRHYLLGTCGDDGRSRFWDLRNTSQPLISRSDHSHWVWSLRYNHYHDELIATGSSDTRVLIARIQSISSSSICLEENEMSKEKLSDGIIATFDQHEDSVYAVEWSSADPWVLASLSYDGRLLINRVPKAEKYKILL